MDPDPDPTPDLTPFFMTFKDAKKNIFYNLPAGTSSVLKIYFFAKILCQNFILQALFQAAQHLYEKREGSGAVSGSIPLINGSGSGSGRPKNMRIRIPNTAFLIIS
jgi:hypothetical protein